MPRNKNKANVRHSVTNEIITSNSKNIGYNVKKDVVLTVERKSKVVYELIEKKLCGPILKERQFLPIKSQHK